MVSIPQPLLATHRVNTSLTQGEGQNALPFRPHSSPEQLQCLERRNLFFSLRDAAEEHKTCYDEDDGSEMRAVAVRIVNGEEITGTKEGQGSGSGSDGEQRCNVGSIPAQVETEQ